MTVIIIRATVPDGVSFMIFQDKASTKFRKRRRLRREEAGRPENREFKWPNHSNPAVGVMLMSCQNSNNVCCGANFSKNKTPAFTMIPGSHNSEPDTVSFSLSLSPPPPPPPYNHLGRMGVKNQCHMPSSLS